MKELPFNDWADRLRAEWELAFAKGDFLDDDGPGAHLRPATRAMLQSALGRFLRFLQSSRGLKCFQLDSSDLNPDLLSIYVDARRATCSERSIAIELRQIRSALLLLFPGLDLTWLLNAAKRIERNAPAKKQMLHLVTSDRLYLIGLKLMDQAMQDSRELGVVSKRSAFEYRDGLIILLLSLIPLRRRTLTALRVGKHLIRSGELWALDIPAEDTKSNMPMEFSLCDALSRRIDAYLDGFRPRIPNAAGHNGLWVSNKGNPMDDGTIYDMVRRRTKAELGFGVNLHRFRHAALTFWSIEDPNTIRAGKDLLGHRSFGTTEKFYIMAQSRIAGRVLAAAWTRNPYRE
jgi:integrase